MTTRRFFLDSLYISTGQWTYPININPWENSRGQSYHISIIIAQDSLNPKNLSQTWSSRSWLDRLWLWVMLPRGELSRCEIGSDLNLLLNHSQSPTAFTSLIVSTGSEVWSHPLNISSLEILVFVLSNISTDQMKNYSRRLDVHILSGICSELRSLLYVLLPQKRDFSS